jgi:hypothetical protein
MQGAVTRAPWATMSRESVSPSSQLASSDRHRRRKDRRGRRLEGQRAHVVVSSPVQDPRPH